MADSKLTALTELSVVALDDITYVVDDVAGTPTSVKLSLNRLGGLFLPGLCGGRLTTESGVPVSTSDRTSPGTLYLTPFVHNRVALYDGTRPPSPFSRLRSSANIGTTTPWSTSGSRVGSK